MKWTWRQCSHTRPWSWRPAGASRVSQCVGDACWHVARKRQMQLRSLRWRWNCATCCRQPGITVTAICCIAGPIAAGRPGVLRPRRSTLPVASSAVQPQLSEQTNAERKCLQLVGYNLVQLKQQKAQHTTRRTAMRAREACLLKVISAGPDHDACNEL